MLISTKLHHFIRLRVLIQSRCIFKANRVMEPYTVKPGDGLVLKQHFASHKKKQVKKLNLYKEKIGRDLPIGTVQLQVCGTGSFGSAKSVILFTQHTSYLFNCGDGITRQFLETCPRAWNRLDRVFCTYKSWDRLGGSIDIACQAESVNGSASKSLHFHGYGRVDCMVDEGKRSFGANLFKPVIVHPSNEIYEDHVMTVESIRLAHAKKPADDELAAAAFQLKLKNKRVCDPNKLISLCLRPGPWLGQLLSSGEPVEVDGKMVRLEDVAKPPECLKTFTVIDCPTADHLPSLMERAETLKRIYINDTEKTEVMFVVHLTPDDIFKRKEYQEWMSGFSQNTKHLIVSEVPPYLLLESAWQQQVHLNLIDNNIFPLLYPKPVESDSMTAEAYEKSTEESNRIYLKPAADYKIRPEESQPLSEKIVSKPSMEEAFKYFEDRKEEVYKALSNRSSQTNVDDKREYPVISMLGTSSSMSGKTRNPTGILVQYSESSYMLLDCGGGTYHQLCSLYGPKTREILMQLKGVFISHGHTDHHIGLLSILQARVKAFQEEGLSPPELVLMAPKKMGSWFLHIMNEFKIPIDNIRFTANNFILFDKPPYPARGNTPRDIHPPQPSEFTETPSMLEHHKKYLTELLGLKYFASVRAAHAYSYNCFGIILEGKDWKIVFSGDTMPCKEMIDAAKKADLLIHESTLDDSKEHDAKLKTHSTVGQALDVAKSSKAKFTLLTHFSARYPRFPVVTERLFDADRVAIAFDNCVFRLRDLPNLTTRNLVGVLQKLYPEHVNVTQSRRLLIDMLKLQGVPEDEILTQVNQSTIKLMEMMEGSTSKSGESQESNESKKVKRPAKRSKSPTAGFSSDDDSSCRKKAAVGSNSKT